MNVFSLIQSALDVILPRRERSVRAEKYTLADCAPSPRAFDACGTTIATLMEYKNPAVGDCIRALKYDDSESVAAILAVALADYLTEEIARVRIFSAGLILIAPIPLHPTRQNERGFNQIERVLMKLPDEFKNGTLAQLEMCALTRVRNTPPQTKLSRHERLTNVTGAFVANSSNAKIRCANIFLIDDIATTGATLAEAAHALERAGARVITVALAHA